MRVQEQMQMRSNLGMGEVDPHAALMKTQIDNDFGANKYINRHVGMIGTKQMRRYMDTDYVSRDQMNEMGSIDFGARKNPKNVNGRTR